MEVTYLKLRGVLVRCIALNGSLLNIILLLTILDSEEFQNQSQRKQV